MSQPMTPSPAPAPKKKMSPLAWVAIGCGAVVVLGIVAVVVMVAAGGWFIKKQADKFAQNPAIAAAELAVRANPELEVVESDPAAGTLTVRNKKTGEVVTWNADELEQGKFSITTSEGTATFEGTGGGQEGGTFKVTNEKGEVATITGSSGGPSDLPAWVPSYPGGTTAGSFDSTTTEGRSAAFTVSTSDGIAEVMAFYKGRLEALGLKVETSSTEANGRVALATVSGGSADQKRTVTVMVTPGDGGRTSAVVTFTEKP